MECQVLWFRHLRFLLIWSWSGWGFTRNRLKCILAWNPTSTVVRVTHWRGLSRRTHPFCLQWLTVLKEVNIIIKRRMISLSLFEITIAGWSRNSFLLLHPASNGTATPCLILPCLVRKRITLFPPCKSTYLHWPNATSRASDTVEQLTSTDTMTQWALHSSSVFHISNLAQIPVNSILERLVNGLTYPHSHSFLSRGTGPHGGTPAIAAGEPLPTEKRINLILYPRGEFVNRTLPIIYPCYTRHQLADYSFFTDGAACFGTDEYQILVSTGIISAHDWSKQKARFGGLKIPRYNSLSLLSPVPWDHISIPSRSKAWP